MRKAYQVAYELSHGPIQIGHYILHACDNPLCCNPAHLSAGTPQQNAVDMHRRGRHPTDRAGFKPGFGCRQ